MKLNRAGLEHALALMMTGDWALNTVWATNQPTAAQLAARSADEIAQWHLAINDDGTYALPVGDFRRVHRSGVIAAKRAAETAQHAEIVAAADEILDLFDRLNAC